MIKSIITYRQQLMCDHQVIVLLNECSYLFAEKILSKNRRELATQSNLKLEFPSIYQAIKLANWTFASWL